MASVDVVNTQNKKIGSVDLNPEVFEKPVRQNILYDVVRWQLACRRQGTHATKRRGEVSGGGAKPFRQKGTGNARQGSSRSPLNEGGAVTFGPQPRDYSYSLPKKIREAGLKMALSHLQKEGRLKVVDKLASENGKTKELAQELKTMGLEKSLLVDADKNEKIERASRNMPRFKFLSVAGLNVYDLLKYDGVVLTQEALTKLEERFGLGK